MTGQERNEGRPTALRIPCPRSDDEDNPPWTYWWWFRLYHRSRQVRHWLGLHDWAGPGPVGERGLCTWCGAAPNAAVDHRAAVEE